MTEHNIPANAEGSSNNKSEMKAAFDTGLTLAALINVCRAAAHLIEDDDGHFSKTVPADLAKTLEHAERLTSNILVSLERIGAA